MVGGVFAPPEAVEQQRQESKNQKVVFVFEGACLEVGKIGRALLQVLDSPLNKAGKVSAIYVHTEKNAVIDINPQVRIPRTFKRFCALMVQLLQTLSIRATNGPDKLMKIVKSPVTLHLPSDSHRILLSYSAKELTSPQQLVKQLPDNKPIVFMVGAFAHGKIEANYQDQEVKISDYPLSAAYCVTRLTNALESKWDVI